MDTVGLQSKSALNKCDTLIPPGWCIYYSLAPWRMLSVSSSPSYLQKPGWVHVTDRLVRFDRKRLTSVSSSLSAVLDLVSPSAIGLGLCSVLSDLLMLPLWRHSFTFPRTKFSKMPETFVWWKNWNKCFCFILCVLPCRYYLRCYIFVSQLEVLNIPYTVQSFLSTPKEGLVKGLWKNHSHEPQVTRNKRLPVELQATAYRCSLCVL